MSLYQNSAVQQFQPQPLNSPIYGGIICQTQILFMAQRKYIILTCPAIWVPHERFNITST